MKIRLRTKFLLSLLAISAGLTSGTLLIVRYSVQEQVRGVLREDLRNSVNTYQSFERQRRATLTRSAELLANLPIVRALMTTRDAATIQDGAADIWRLSGSDLLLLADRAGAVVAMRTSTTDLAAGTVQELFTHSRQKEEVRGWWFGGGHLYEVWIQPIYFGASSENTVLGYLAVGHEIDERAAKDFSSIASSEVAFHWGDTLVASTLPAGQEAELEKEFRGGRVNSPDAPQEISVGRERYLMTTVRLPSESGTTISLSVLKSFDKATSFLRQLNRVLLGLGLVSVLAGGLSVLMLSGTFTRPLANLVAGVRALERGDFSYPLEGSGGDEVAEVTSAFDRMRSSLQETQHEQRQLEERLRQAHKMEAVGRLAGGVAHDFNNLLTIIRGHCDLQLDRSSEDDIHRRNAEQIRKAADRAVGLTRQLLAFSRMQVLQPRVLDLNVVVADLGRMLPRLIGEHIEYHFVPGPKLAAVKADPGQIEQVIMNLAVNARDAMRGGGKLTVRTANIEMSESDALKRPPMSPGSYVLLSVADTGHGMDEETLTHIFEPFFTTKEVGKGTGLGLATVYGVVKQSAGFIWVHSSPGNGAIFEIYLPQVVGKVAEAEAEGKPSAVPGGCETILVVEDEAGVRELACEFLKVSGYTVLQAKDGQEALEVAERHSGTIHLVLTDMVMPRMSGGELAKRLKAIRPDLKIGFMSGYSEFPSHHGGKHPPQAFVLRKPFSLASLVAKVREVLAGDPVAEPSRVE
jgi:signal transduction histidine kinase/CheY-like chemotaxis protein